MKPLKRTLKDVQLQSGYRPVNAYLRTKRTMFAAVCLILILSACSSSRPIPETASIYSAEVEAMLTVADDFFLALEQSDFNLVWLHLSIDSRETIIRDTYKSLKKQGLSLSKEDIAMNFAQRKSIFTSYWTSMRQSYDPFITVLKITAWEIDSISSEGGTILITHKKAKTPTRLKMIKEDTGWKVGLTETFWTRTPGFPFSLL
ncbi:MAG: hypothetical protein ISR96_12705 [Nitrospira sp.]|nr:hypothetical protein [bacterium]MBL7050366.1 hypothetical protein [Nitrospira sp.]